MKAKIVYDGSGVHLPEEMMPLPKNASNVDFFRVTKSLSERGLLAGSELENVAELAGRICYDSLSAKKCRKSEDYHVHIHQVGHYSVYEHTPITIALTAASMAAEAELYRNCSNRPGVWIQHDNDEDIYRVTANFRAIIEWDEHGDGSNYVGEALKTAGHSQAPMIITKEGDYSGDHLGVMIDPKFEHEQWISMYMQGSRGFSHEQVRHKYMTAVSQRSTRYVDESSSSWVIHPLLSKIIQETGNESLKYINMNVSEVACKAYDDIARILQKYLIDRGVDKFTARKQARGAARGYLGNALSTEMIFSASVSQWNWMLKMRASKFADAEIRVIYAGYDDSSPCVINALRQSRYASYFKRWRCEDSPDGIGRVCVFGD